MKAIPNRSIYVIEEGKEVSRRWESTEGGNELKSPVLQYKVDELKIKYVSSRSMFDWNLSDL